MDYEELSEKIDKYLTKQGFGLQDKYFITKGLQEGYWSTIRGTEEEIDDFEEEDDVEEEGEFEETPMDDEELEKPKSRHKSIVKKPKIRVKKDGDKRTD